MSTAKDIINKQVAHAIRFSEKEDGVWLNSWGAPIENNLPDFCSFDIAAQIVCRSFDKGTFTGEREEMFSDAYDPDMSPMEVCTLALAVTLAVKK